ncbi:sodium:proton antiporter [Legionella anisa]|uniref:Sodium:proton antiporter n=1 Tax=Legionella anisa TaxID=28082 RepID=A0AAX0WSJ1_9GAMM|nr:sodium:proton antiporter [Legionella anisa]AWN74513.1 sodium:proton antiporter [Legionella anisa]KTC76577.1 K(+)/H(+) antiporter NhaP [Legionella anisa]MBN5935722.1 sodium:proton antiporter [Legionella anisa]MCW8425374.1 cation:proton antiporter [Legionella anisa]MCW8449195.1 cation:proton antiporter [Legionella anisa]
MPEKIFFIFSLILLAGFVCQWLASHLKLPAIIFLLLSGIFFGPIMHWLRPDEQLGGILSPFVSFSVAVILFEGSMTLKFSKIGGIGSVIRNLISVGALITFLCVAVATHFLIKFSWEISFLFASLMVVSGPTVIAPMLRILRPNAHVANVLRWEGILIDPIGAILAVLVFEFIVSNTLTDGFISGAFFFGKIILSGISLGIIGALSIGVAFKKYWIPQYLQNFAVLSAISLIFATSTIISESGLLAVTVMGLTLANIKGIELDDILNFKESLSLVLLSLLFIILAARIDLSSFIDLGYPALLLFLVIQFIIRPLNVYLSSLGSTLTMPERHMIAWIAPRGIIAAAISALFAMRLGSLGFSEASKLVPLTFLMIIGTIVLQSLTAKKIALKLKVAEPEPQGFLIIGANKVALAIAKQLHENNFYVCLIDEDWSALSNAKMKGFATIWGNPISQHVEDNLNLLKIKHLLILTPYLQLNILAAKHYRYFFPEREIFAIQTVLPQEGQREEKFSFKHSGRDIFKQDVTYQCIENLLNLGCKIKTTLITGHFSYEQYLNIRSVPLFAIDPKGCIYVFTIKPTFTPTKGWKIIGVS